MAYPVTEQETTIVYEQETRVFTIYTTVPKHIRRISKKLPMFKLLQVDKDSEGEVLAIKVSSHRLPPASTFN